MKERPILFSAPMVRAILEGRKTQTRRVVKHRFPHLNNEPYYATGRVLTDLPTQPGAWMEYRYRQQDEPGFTGSPASALVSCPYGQPGDRLWVRETWAVNPYTPEVRYRATDELWTDAGPLCWRPSIHMPRDCCRIRLEIVSVRVERLNDISAEDAIAEGAMLDDNGRRKVYGYSLPVDEFWRMAPSDAYMHLWESINGTGSWAVNPFVWCIEFKRVQP